jgi:site-specific recombinase XerD
MDGGLDQGVRGGAQVRSVGLIGHPDAGCTELYRHVLDKDQTPVEILWLYL